MRLIAIKSNQRLENNKFDLIVAASGFEERCTKILDFNLLSPKKVILAFENHRDLEIRSNNDSLFANAGFEMIPLDGSNSIEAEKHLLEILEPLPKDSRILFDISSMTRCWYGALIRLLRDKADKRSIEVVFFYTPAKFEKPISRITQNKIVAPVWGFEGVSLPVRQTALCVGLGYEKTRALGIYTQLDPGKTFAFISRPATDPKYYEETRRANKTFLQYIPSTNLVEYPIKDFLATFDSLLKVCRSMNREWNIVLVSQGPKIFSLATFLVSLLVPNSSVWRVSAGERNPTNHCSSGEPILTTINWKGN